MLIQRLQGNLEKASGIYYEFDIHSKPLGVGGMGKVYLGSKVIIETGARLPVAVKAMYEDVPENVIERARRESSIQLKHENLVEMMGFVETNDTTSMGGNIKHYHVVSEFVNGVMLSDLLCGMTKNQFGVDLEAAQQLYADYTNDKVAVSVKIIKQVLSGVMALHDNGYIHRDIDPSNIMITDKGTIKLIDFGIAKRIQTLGTQDKSLTSNGAFIGKAQYAAPELVTGDVNHQNVTTDIYSIGILLYQLLTGKLPFSGPTHSVLDAQLHKKIPLKGIKNRDLKKIVSKATEKNQKNRYQSAAEFRVAVDSVVLNNGKAINWGKYVIYACVVAVVGSLSFLAIKYKDQIIKEKKQLVENDTITDSSNDTIIDLPGLIVTPINNTISVIFKLQDKDFSQLTELAKSFYNNRVTVTEEECGKNLLKTDYADTLLTACRNNTEYSNVKVSFLLFAELKRIGVGNNNPELIDISRKYLKNLKKYNNLYIK